MWSNSRESEDGAGFVGVEKEKGSQSMWIFSWDELGGWCWDFGEDHMF